MSGQHDFDFLFGPPWRVRNHRLGDDGWQRFDARAEVQPLLGGLGHLDRVWFAAFPGHRAPVEAFTVRLYDPAEDLWRIWWSSSIRPGHFDEPMLGRFADGLGTFYGRELASDTRATLRFLWKPHEPDGPRWEQARSTDGRETWRTDWTMDLVREPA